jgi:hypothetical protein
VPRCSNNQTPRKRFPNDSLVDETFNKTVTEAFKQFYTQLGWDTPKTKRTQNNTQTSIITEEKFQKKS